MARGEPIWQTSSTGPTSMPELERGGGHQGPQVAGPQSLLDDPAPGGREAAVVGGHLQGGVDRVDVGQPVGVVARSAAGAPGDSAEAVMGDPLGHLAGVDEDQGGAVLEDVGGDAVEDVARAGAAGHRFELARRQLDGHVEVALVAAVDDGGRRPGRVGARQEPGHHLEGALGGRQPDALEAAPVLGHQPAQALEAEGEVGAALVAGQGVDLVDDHRVHASAASTRDEAAVRSR